MDPVALSTLFWVARKVFNLAKSWKDVRSKNWEWEVCQELAVEVEGVLNDARFKALANRQGSNEVKAAIRRLTNAVEKAEAFVTQQSNKSTGQKLMDDKIQLKTQANKIAEDIHKAKMIILLEMIMMKDAASAPDGSQQRLGSAPLHQDSARRSMPSRVNTLPVSFHEHHHTVFVHSVAPSSSSASSPYFQDFQTFVQPSPGVATLHHRSPSSPETTADHDPHLSRTVFPPSIADFSPSDPSSPRGAAAANPLHSPTLLQPPTARVSHSKLSSPGGAVAADPAMASPDDAPSFQNPQSRSRSNATATIHRPPPSRLSLPGATSPRQRRSRSPAPGASQHHHHHRAISQLLPVTAERGKTCADGSGGAYPNLKKLSAEMRSLRPTSSHPQLPSIPKYVQKFGASIISDVLLDTNDSDEYVHLPVQQECRYSPFIGDRSMVDETPVACATVPRAPHTAAGDPQTTLPLTTSNESHMNTDDVTPVSTPSASFADSNSSSTSVATSASHAGASCSSTNSSTTSLTSGVAVYISCDRVTSSSNTGVTSNSGASGVSSVDTTYTSYVDTSSSRGRRERHLHVAPISFEADAGPTYNNTLLVTPPKRRARSASPLPGLRRAMTTTHGDGGWWWQGSSQQRRRPACSHNPSFH